MVMTGGTMENRDFHAISPAEEVNYRRSGFFVAGITALVYSLLLLAGRQHPLLLIAAVIIVYGAWFEVLLLRKAVDFLILTGNIIHRFTNPLVFGFIYIVGVVPTAAILKIAANDVLRLNYDEKRQTYWQSRPAGTEWKDFFKNQF